MKQYVINQDFFISLNKNGVRLNFNSGNSYQTNFPGLISTIQYLDKENYKNYEIDFEKQNEVKSMFNEENKDSFNFVEDYTNLSGMTIFLSHYHGACCQQKFLDYSKDGLEKDFKSMDKAYVNETLLPSAIGTLNESNIIDCRINDKIKKNFNSIYKSSDNQQKSVDLNHIKLLLNNTVGVRDSYIDRYGRKRRLKLVPSGGNNHPTNVYVIIKGDSNIANCYYYNHILNSLILVGGNLDFNSIISSAHIMTDRINFNPQICLLYSQTPQRTIFRYKDQRTYRVINMDLGHVLTAVKDVATAMGLNCSHSYEPDNHSLDFLKSMNCSITEPLMASSIIGV